MKLNISREEQISNYVNLNPLEGDDIQSLDKVCDDNECEEILAKNIVNILRYSEFKDVIAHYVKKLRHGGVLVIGGTDISNIAFMLVNGLINLDEVNKLVYGNQKTSWDFNQCATNVFEVSDLLSKLGLRIEYRNTINGHFIIKAKRQ